jgi:hypothetical protein
MWSIIGKIHIAQIIGPVFRQFKQGFAAIFSLFRQIAHFGGLGNEKTVVSLTTS